MENSTVVGGQDIQFAIASLYVHELGPHQAKIMSTWILTKPYLPLISPILKLSFHENNLFPPFDFIMRKGDRFELTKYMHINKTPL